MRPYFYLTLLNATNILLLLTAEVLLISNPDGICYPAGFFWYYTIPSQYELSKDPKVPIKRVRSVHNRWGFGRQKNLQAALHLWSCIFEGGKNNGATGCDFKWLLPVTRRNEWLGICDGQSWRTFDEVVLIWCTIHLQNSINSTLHGRMCKSQVH